MPALGLLRDLQSLALRIRTLKFDLYLARKDKSEQVEQIASALKETEGHWPAVCPVASSCCGKGKGAKREGENGRRLPSRIVCNATTEEWANTQNACPYTRS